MSNTKVTYDLGFSGSNRDMTVSDAVQHMLDGNDYDRGRSETVEAAVNNQSEFLGNLTQILYDKKILSKSDLESLLRWYTIHE